MKFMKVAGSLFPMFAAMIMTTSAVHAILPVPGVFEAFECGATASETEYDMITGIREVCLGQVTATEDQPAKPSVQFRMVNGSSVVYHVTHVDHLLMAFLSGKTKAVMFLASDFGDQVSMKVIRSPEGKVESAQGTLAGQSYLVKEFKPVDRVF